MPAFAYTTGNPNNLVANQNASMADIQGPFTDLRTFLNGGTMDETNVPNLAAAFTTYKRLQRASAIVTGTASTSTVYVLMMGNAITNGTLSGGANPVGVYDSLLYLDPAEYAANSRVTKLNLRVAAVPNTSAPGTTFTTSLYPIATYAGASQPLPATVGTLISGSSVAIASPGASTLVTATSGDFNMPAAGAYLIGVTLSGIPTGASQTALIATLSMRQV